MTTAVLDYLKVQSLPEVKINWKIVCAVGFLMCFALLVFYVWQVNILTRGYYLINGYQKQASQLAQENKNLQVSFAENSFLGQVSAKIQALNFQKTTSVKYIQIVNGSVAVAK